MLTNFLAHGSVLKKHPEGLISFQFFFVQMETLSKFILGLSHNSSGMGLRTKQKLENLWPNLTYNTANIPLKLVPAYYKSV